MKSCHYWKLKKKSLNSVGLWFHPGSLPVLQTNNVNLKKMTGTGNHLGANYLTVFWNCQIQTDQASWYDLHGRNAEKPLIISHNSIYLFIYLVMYYDLPLRFYRCNKTDHQKDSRKGLVSLVNKLSISQRLHDLFAVPLKPEPPECINVPRERCLFYSGSSVYRNVFH